MFYQLPNGRVIEISTEQFIDMSDEELEYLIAYNYGDIIENPWHGSILNRVKQSVIDEVSEQPVDLTSASEIEKLLDLDFEDPEK